jgi:AcrR family transcriptional regulator
VYLIGTLYLERDMSRSRHPKEPNQSQAAPDGDGPGRPIWARPTKDRREPLTQEKIVAAAVELADGKGLDAVSIRRLAAALGTRPMSLYSFIERKEDLLDLMVDEVLAGAVLDEVPDDWREALTAIAHAMRAVSLAHPWQISAAGQRPQLGPNLMRHIEQGLSATASLDIGWSTKRAILRAVDTYALGYAQSGSGPRQSRLRAKLDDPGWRTSVQEYLQGLLDTGRFPNLAEVGAEGFLSESDEEPVFETGLDWLLTGIAAQLGLPSSRS